MLQSKFCGNRFTGSEEDFEGVYRIWTWYPCWSCDQDIANKEAPHKILNLTGQVVSETIFEIVTSF